MNKRKICVVTGTRAEYGLLYWLMKDIQEDKALRLQVIVTGAHLSPEFGLTYKVIEQDGFSIDDKVEMLLSSDTPIGISKSMGLATIGFAEALERLKPDIMVVLGDRYEMLAAVQAAMVANIPIAHIHGGEVTEGAIDESIRHSITKMSHIHFVATKEYEQRVIQLGEGPNKVFNYGAPGLDNITRLELLSLTDLEKSIGFELGGKYFLVTYHPVTTSPHKAREQILSLLEALEEYPEHKLLITKPNSDTGGRVIIQVLEEYAHKNQERVSLHTSLGQVRYLSAVKYAQAVIGNSSSGIVEVPAMHVPTVNIGNRQQGRLVADSIISCGESKAEIVDGVKKALSEEFSVVVGNSCSLYGQGDASRDIKNKLKDIDLTGILVKKFYDLK